MNPAEVMRSYGSGDLNAVADIYRDAVRGITPGLYTSAQVNAWAAYAETGDELGRLMARGTGWIIGTTEGIEAFILLEPPDYVSLLYCRARASRRGYANRLLEALETEARRLGTLRVHTAASLISHPLFLRRGYKVDWPECVERHGVSFDRYRMSKDLT